MAAKTRRVSSIYKLGRSQPTLDFVDVDVSTDTPVFLSPRALTLLPSEWADECTALIQNFFSYTLDLTKTNKEQQAIRLLSQLSEPNETHLGLSTAHSRGRALGTGSAHDVWESLSHSVAAKSGLLRDLEDTVLMVHGVGVDIISDITTNIIREPLIAYTQEQCRYHNIPMVQGLASGPLWDPKKKAWHSKFVELPVLPEGKLLLVPKAIVRREPLYDVQQYYRWHIIEFLRREEISTGGSLVYLLRDGTPKVDIGDLKEKYGTGKKTIVRETLRNPDILTRFKSEIEKELYVPLGHEELANAERADLPDWDKLLAAVLAIPTGKADASLYEKAVEALFTALLYLDLTNPSGQHNIHNGRKRIDIRYTNAAQGGFFEWLSKHYPSANIFVECKNYGKEVGNPELDQLAGRFSPSRGQVGLLVCRSFQDKLTFQKRCRDTANDARGYIIALDDDDLTELMRVRKNDMHYQRWHLLSERFGKLTD